MSYRILIFEDDDERIKWLSQEFIGNIVHCTDSVKEAIELLCNYDFDLIMLDNDIEESHYENTNAYNGTGRELADWIAATELNNSPIIVIHSCNTNASQYMFDVLRPLYPTIKKSFVEIRGKGIESVINL